MDIESENAVEGWEVFPRREVLRTRVATIYEGSVGCVRSGRQKIFSFFDFPEWVNIIALTPEREIVLVRQFRYGSNRMEIEIPGGTVDSGEDPRDAGCRELLEETGYAGINPRHIGKVCPNPAIQGNFCHTIFVEDVRKIQPPRLDEMEDIECFSLPIPEVMKLVAQGDINHGLVLNALMFFKALRS
jgi:8-oxo-dGTP pyrophosphatase MutT (NUDIX family)